MSFQIYFLDTIHEHERITVSVANSEEDFNNTTVKELKRKLIPEDELENTILLYRYNTLKKNRTLGSYGVKHQDLISTERRGVTYSFEDDDDDEDEGTEMHRTQSIEHLALMQQPHHK